MSNWETFFPSSLWWPTFQAFLASWQCCGYHRLRDEAPEIARDDCSLTSCSHLWQVPWDLSDIGESRYYTELEESFRSFLRKIPHSTDVGESLSFPALKTILLPVCTISSLCSREDATVWDVLFHKLKLVPNFCIWSTAQRLFWGTSALFPNFYTYLESHKPFEWDGGSFFNVRSKICPSGDIYSKTLHIYLSSAASKNSTAIKQIALPLLLMSACSARVSPSSQPLCINTVTPLHSLLSVSQCRTQLPKCSGATKQKQWHRNVNVLALYCKCISITIKICELILLISIWCIVPYASVYKHIYCIYTGSTVRV